MNFYETLGVSADATDQQIKEAYRRGAMKWHPDRHEGVAAKAHADKKFKELALAYRTLRNRSTREAYDREVEHKLREEYNARQREQAQQQKEWAQQEKNRQHFTETDTQPQEEAISDDDANQMFFEQMLDLAFELAGRAFPESKIFQALVALGCPESMAKAVATVAIKKFANLKKKKEEPTIKTITAPISKAEWKDAEPYYLAFVIGKDKSKPLLDSEYKKIDSQYKKRINALITTIALAIGGFLLIKTDFDFETKLGILLIIASFIFTAFILVNFFTLDERYYKESKKIKIINAFRAIHVGENINSFNFYAFFFNIIWLSYRKMYLFAFLGAIFYAAAALISHFHLNLNFKIIAAIQFGISALIGIFSYRIYYIFAKTKINQHLNNAPDLTHQLVKKKYGASAISAIAGLFFVSIISFPAEKIISLDVEKKARQEQLAAEENKRAILATAIEKQRVLEEEENAARATKEIAYTKAEYESALDYIEARHPELNPKSSHHNSYAVSWVVERKNTYEGQGLTKIKALQQAIQEYEFEIQKSLGQTKKIDSILITEQSYSGNYIGEGELVSLNFVNIEINSLLQLFSDFTNLSIKQDDEVSGSVSIRLRDTPWDEALSKVIHAKNLKIIKTGPTTLYVYPNYMSDDFARTKAINIGLNK